MYRLTHVLLTLALLLAAGLGWAQQPTEDPRARDLHEEVVKLPVTVSDAFGRKETVSIPVTIFRPNGDGPFPLIVMNHGRAPGDKRAEQTRARYDHLARYLTRKGFTVFVPTRVGYGETYGSFDPEGMGSCGSPMVAPAAAAVADQVQATVAFARSLPYVDASRWLVMGQSLGGFTAVSVAARQPAGLVGAVNFSGGHGGDPDRRPGDPCSAVAITRLWGDLAAASPAKAQGAAPVPMLWLYWENDRYWGPSIPVQWHRAWTEGGGRAEFHQLPPVGKDGHSGLGADMDHWVPYVEDYLARLGFTQSGLIARPPASGFASVDDLAKVPGRSGFVTLYKRFLESKPPRAFAFGADGAMGYAAGDWAIGRALGFCQQRRGAPCQLYAVDDDVVWKP